MMDNAAMNKLITAAVDVRKQSYSPYSGYGVGAAVLSAGGSIYAGCNVENAAYPLGFCAEANAIGNMIASGDRQIDHIVIVGPKGDVCTPCGGCRQRIREFAAAEDTPVTVCDAGGSIMMETNIGALLPHSFGPNNLKSVDTKK